MYRSSWGRDFRRGVQASIRGEGKFAAVAGALAVLVLLLSVALDWYAGKGANRDVKGWRQLSRRGLAVFFGEMGFVTLGALGGGSVSFNTDLADRYCSAR